MNAKYFLIVILLFSFGAFAQNKVVPTKVSDSFKKLYPKATEVKWDKEGNDFEANFKNGETEMSVVLGNDGELLETETTIEISQLPDGIDKYVADNFEGYKIIDAAKIVKANREELFEVEVSNGKNQKDLYFDSNGNPESSDVKKEDKEDQD